SNHARDFKNGNILEPSIVDAGVLRIVEQEQVEVGNVLDVDVWPRLVAAEHSDAAILESLHGQHVDRNVEPHTRRKSADRSRTHDLYHHLAVIGENDPFPAHL